MRPVVRVSGKRLTVGTEISIVAHGTLVTIPSNVVGLVLAEGSITPNVIVGHNRTSGARNMFINGSKPVSWVNVASTLDTVAAVIPVGAVEAFVANTIDILCEFSFMCKTIQKTAPTLSQPSQVA